MKPFLPMAALLLAAPSHVEAAPARSQERQCWLDAMSDTEKRQLVMGYANIQNTEGKVRADAWAQAKKAEYSKKAIASGACPAQRAAGAPGPAPSGNQQQEPRLLNRFGKPCKRIELENQNVPNVGGSMGWALIQVCKD